MFPGPQNRFLLLSFCAAFLLLTARSAVAHAILVESTPALHGSAVGPDVPLKLRFNVRIDLSRSRLTLIGPDGSTQTLQIDTQAPPDTILSQAKGLSAGAYRLRWQVLASDGHITRGEIPFTVTKA
jgi:methionine-rich copper-binding protein CopC